MVLCRGVSWSGRRPVLDLSAVGGGESMRVPLPARLGWSVVSPLRYCVGFHGATGRTACPRDAVAVAGSRCRDCEAREQFRFVHQAHVGGWVPASLEPYLAEPQWLYVATFADGRSKVGTATEHRRHERIDEQGAVLAAFVVRAGNGRAVRELEDRVSTELGLPQHRGRHSKVLAFTTLVDRTRVLAEHESAVRQVVDLVGVEGSEPEVWAPSLAAVPLADARGAHRWVPYPHDVTAGQHGFAVDACCGPAALVRLRDQPDAVPYVVDLGALKGRRLVLGPFTSAEVDVQESLF